jgi:hypothetical protein
MTFKIAAITTILMCSCAGLAFAQSKPSDRSTYDSGSGSVAQPQVETGPINTKSGGAPASSPQGETPPGMQSAPKGSDKTIRTDKAGVPEGAPKN